MHTHIHKSGCTLILFSTCVPCSCIAYITFVCECTRYLVLVHMYIVLGTSYLARTKCTFSTRDTLYLYVKREEGSFPSEKETVQTGVATGGAYERVN